MLRKIILCWIFALALAEPEPQSAISDTGDLLIPVYDIETFLSRLLGQTLPDLPTIEDEFVDMESRHVEGVQVGAKIYPQSAVGGRQGYYQGYNPYHQNINYPRPGRPYAPHGSFRPNRYPSYTPYPYGPYHPNRPYRPGRPQRPHQHYPGSYPTVYPQGYPVSGVHPVGHRPTGNRPIGHYPVSPYPISHQSYYPTVNHPVNAGATVGSLIGGLIGGAISPSTINHPNSVRPGHSKPVTFGQQGHRRGQKKPHQRAIMQNPPYVGLIYL